MDTTVETLSAFSAVLCAASLTSVHAAQPITEPEFASDIVDRYADHIFTAAVPRDGAGCYRR